MTTVLVQAEPREARERAARIRAGITSYLHTLADIAAAYAQRDWDALGYADWQSYVDGEYSEHRLKLSPEHRQKAVAELRLAGMSQRAIGSALGVDAATVNRDLRGVADATPEEIQGADGKTYAATRPQAPTNKTAAEVEASPSADGADVVAGAVTGNSGTDHGVAGQPGATGMHTAGNHAASASAGSVSSPDPAEVTPEAVSAATDRTLPDPLLTDEDAAMRGSHTFAQSLASLFLALDPDPIRWATNRWRPDAFPNRDLPRVRDAFTNEGLRTLADHLYSLADHLESTGSTL